MSDINEIINATINGIKEFTDAGSVVGDAINTPSGVTVIPISKITIALVGGGADYGQKKLTQTQNFGGGSGTGISISPVAFLTVSPNADVNIIPLNTKKNNQDRIFSVLEKTPEILQKLRGNLS